MKKNRLLIPEEKIMKRIVVLRKDRVMLDGAPGRTLQSRNQGIKASGAQKPRSFPGGLYV